MPSKPIAEPELIVLQPDQWVDEYGNYLFRYAQSRLRDANAAEEVVQETFMAGIRYFDQFAGRGSQRGWLMGILKRKIIDFVRKRAKHDKAGSFEDETDPSIQLFDAKGNWKPGAIPWSPQPDEKIQSNELWQVVRECLSTLPQTQADVFVLSVMEDMDSEDICRELDISPSNMWVRMHRARLGLAKCVGAKWLVSGEVKDVK